MSVLTTQFAASTVDISNNVLTINLNSELSASELQAINKQSSFAIGFNNIVLETVSNIDVTNNNNSLSVTVNNVTDRVGPQTVGTVYVHQFADATTKADTSKYTFRGNNVLPSFQKTQGGIEFQAAPSFLPADWNFLKVMAIVLPTAAFGPGITIENRTSESLIKFYVGDTTNSITSTTDTAIVVYHAKMAFPNVVTNAWENMYQKLEMLVAKHVEAMGMVIGNDTTQDGITKLVRSVTHNVIADLDPVVAGNRETDEYTKMFDVLFFVVKQLIYNYRKSSPACASGGAQTGVCNIDANSFENVYADPVTGGICKTASPFFCVPFMQELYKVNVIVKKSIATLTGQINSAMGKQSGSTKTSSNMITKAETFHMQNKTIAGIAKQVISNSKSTYISVLIASMLVLGVCIFNIAVTIFMDSAKVQRFISQLMLLVYMIGFVVVVAVGTTTK